MELVKHNLKQQPGLLLDCKADPLKASPDGKDWARSEGLRTCWGRYSRNGEALYTLRLQLCSCYGIRPVVSGARSSDPCNLELEA